jgi:hypothetical protein
MTNQPQAFHDTKGMPWTLTALEAGFTTQFALESSDCSICVVAQKAVIALDETNMQNPFVLELDENTSISIDTAAMENLDGFLQQVAA